MAEDSQSVVTEINGCISQAAKRQYGLLKLATFLENCQYPHELVLLEKASSFWMKTLLAMFESHPVSIHAKLAHYCFYLLIQCSKNASPELSRAIGINFVEKSVTILIQSNNQLSKNSLICLNELITNYKGACAQHKAKIETFVLSKLDSDSDEVVEWASKCYAKLPYLHKNQSNTDMWYAYFKNMLKNANMILNHIFEDHQPAVNMNTQDNESNFIKSQSGQEAQQATTSLNLFLSKSEKLFNKLNKDDLEMYYQKLLKRFRACTLTLGYMFEPLADSVVIKVRSGEIVDFLKRLFFFDIKKLTASCIDMESKFLTSIIGDLYKHTLTFSMKFFQILKTNLLTKANQISHMLAHFGASLKEPIMFSTISTYYDCLREWLHNVGPNSGFNKYSSGVIDAILNNIKPIKKNILTIDSKKMKHSVKIPNDAALFFSDKNLTNTHQLKARSELICSALEFLTYFVRNFSYKFNYNQYEKIQQTLVDILLCVQNNPTSQKPYDQAECRLGLYTNLFELCHAQNNKLAPPLSVAICLFKTALDDSSNQIKSYAQQSLSILRAYSCPMMPIYLREFTIQSAVQAKPQTQTPDKSMLTITNNLASSQQQQQPIHATKTNNFNSGAIMQEESVAAANNINILNNSSKNNINNMINNSLVDMKNTLNIQGAAVADGISLKRKSPINEEDMIKNDIKKPFGNNRVNENGTGGDSNGLGDEDDSEEDLEIIDSEMEQDHEENDDEEEDYSDDEYDEEDDELPEEIDLEEEEVMDDDNVESSSPEAVNEKHLNRSNTKSVTGDSSPYLNGQSSQSQSVTESKQIDIRNDIAQLLKETGGYEDEEEDEEDEDNDEIEEEIIDDEESGHEKSSESKTDSKSNDCSGTAAVPEPDAKLATTLASVEKTTEVVVDDIAEAEALENALTENVKQVEQTQVQSTVEEQIEEAVIENVLETQKSGSEEPKAESEPAIVAETEESNSNEEAQTTVIEPKVNISVAEVSMEVVAGEEVAPATTTEPATTQIDIEKACADFKVDAVLVPNYDSDSKTA